MNILKKTPSKSALGSPTSASTPLSPFAADNMPIGERFEKSQQFWINEFDKQIADKKKIIDLDFKPDRQRMSKKSFFLNFLEFFKKLQKKIVLSFEFFFLDFLKIFVKKKKNLKSD